MSTRDLVKVVVSCSLFLTKFKYAQCSEEEDSFESFVNRKKESSTPSNNHLDASEAKKEEKVEAEKIQITEEEKEEVVKSEPVKEEQQVAEKSEPVVAETKVEEKVFEEKVEDVMSAAVDEVVADKGKEEKEEASVPQVEKAKEESPEVEKAKEEKREDVETDNKRLSTMPVMTPPPVTPAGEKPVKMEEAKPVEKKEEAKTTEKKGRGKKGKVAPVNQVCPFCSAKITGNQCGKCFAAPTAAPSKKKFTLRKTKT